MAESKGDFVEPGDENEVAKEIEAAVWRDDINRNAPAHTKGEAVHAGPGTRDGLTGGPGTAPFAGSASMHGGSGTTPFTEGAPTDTSRLDVIRAQVRREAAATARSLKAHATGYSEPVGLDGLPYRISTTKDKG